MPAPTTTQAAIRRALEAAKDIGLNVAGYTVAKDGTISVTVAGAEAGQHARPAPRQTAPKSWATR